MVVIMLTYAAVIIVMMWCILNAGVLFELCMTIKKAVSFAFNFEVL